MDDASRPSSGPIQHVDAHTVRGRERRTPMAMQTPHDLFLFELSAMHSAEQQIAEMLPQLIQAAGDPQLRQGLEHHLEETQQQVQNLDSAFQALGTQPLGAVNQAVRGMAQDFQTFQQQQPSQQALTGFVVGASLKTEHFEMACYRGLVTKAQLMGHQEVVTLLQQNLQQEETMAQQAEQLGQQLSQQMIQMAGQMSMGSGSDEMLAGQ